MFGCCNNLFSNSCRCNRCNSCNRCNGNTGVVPIPTPIFPPFPTPTPTPNPSVRLRGLQAALTDSAGDPVADGAAVPFNSLISDNTLGVTFLPGSGTFTFGRAGTYLVNWWMALGEGAAVSGAESSTAANGATAFSLTLNGTVVASAFAGAGAGQISGSALVTVSSVPSAMQLINDTGWGVTFAEGTARQAGVTVTQLA